MDVEKVNDEILSITLDKKLKAQMSRINFDKWLEGEKLHCDPGNDFILQWIAEHGKEFHEKFIDSDCRTCKKCYDCGSSGKTDCDKYDPELYEETKHILKKVIKLMIMNDVSTKTIKDICIKYRINF